MILLCEWIAAAGAASQSAREFETAHRDVVVRGMVPAFVADAYGERNWEHVFPLGDLDRDGACDSVMLGIALDRRTGASVERFLFASGFGHGTIRTLDLTPPGTITQNAHRFLSAQALLRCPGGLRLATLDSLTQEVEIREFDSLRLIGRVAYPPSPVPGLSAIEFVDGLFRAGDLGHDGYEDLFFVTRQREGYAVTGAVDCRTLAIPWLEYETAWYDDHGPTWHSEAMPPSDLDLDGVPDFVASFGLYRGVAGSNSLYAVARSGRDGARLWSLEIPGWGSAGMQGTGVDATGDGVADVLLHTGQTNLTLGQVALVDGMLGVEVWRRDDRFLDRQLPFASNYYSNGPIWFDEVRSGRSWGVEACRNVEWFVNGGRRSGEGIAYLDAHTGTLLGYHEYPQTLSPWSSERLGGTGGSRILGDIDRDGFKEFGRSSHAELINDTVSAASIGRHLVLLGRRTLVMPSQVRIGEPTEISLSSPSSAGKPYFLLISETFAPAGGVALDGWSTHLAGTSLLSWSLGNRPCAGVLDASGRATRTFTLPALPVAPGTELFVRAVILAPGTQDRVWTLSSVETVRYE